MQQTLSKLLHLLFGSDANTSTSHIWKPKAGVVVLRTNTYRPETLLSGHVNVSVVDSGISPVRVPHKSYSELANAFGALTRGLMSVAPIMKSPKAASANVNDSR